MYKAKNKRVYPRIPGIGMCRNGTVITTVMQSKTQDFMSDLGIYILNTLHSMYKVMNKRVYKRILGIDECRYRTVIMTVMQSRT